MRRVHIEIAVGWLQRHVLNTVHTLSILYILNVGHVAAVHLQRGLRWWLWSWWRRKVGRSAVLLRSVCVRRRAIGIRCEFDIGKGGGRGQVVDVQRVEVDVGSVHHVGQSQIGQLVHGELLWIERRRHDHVRLGTVLLLQSVQLLELVDLQHRNGTMLLKVHRAHDLLLMVRQQHLERRRVHRHCLRLLMLDLLMLRWMRVMLLMLCMLLMLLMLWMLRLMLRLMVLELLLSLRCLCRRRTRTEQLLSIWSVRSLLLRHLRMHLHHHVLLRWLLLLLMVLVLVLWWR